MSALDLRFLDPGDTAARRAWDEAVETFSGGTVFHTTAWMDVIEKGLGLPSRFAYLADADGSIRALVPLFRAGGWIRRVRWLNLPQGSAADPLAADDATAARLLEQVAQAAARQGVRAVVLRTGTQIEAPVPHGWTFRREDPVVRHVLDLTGATSVETLPRIQKGQKRIYRRVGRRLEASGATVRLVTPEDVGIFTHTVHHIFLKRHGHLGLPARFFEALMDYLPNAARLLLACPQTESPLAFSIMIMGRSQCHLLYGSGLPTEAGTDAYRYCVGLQIEAAIRAGSRSLDFGESGPNQTGLIFFKETWGAQRTDGSYQVLVRAGEPSGLNVTGKDLAVAHRALHYAPVNVSVRLAGLAHWILQ